jgi:hypothetical protein
MAAFAANGPLRGQMARLSPRNGGPGGRRRARLGLAGGSPWARRRLALGSQAALWGSQVARRGSQAARRGSQMARWGSQCGPSWGRGGGWRGGRGNTGPAGANPRATTAVSSASTRELLARPRRGRAPLRGVSRATGRSRAPFARRTGHLRRTPPSAAGPPFASRKGSRLRDLDRAGCAAEPSRLRDPGGVEPGCEASAEPLGAAAPHLPAARAICGERRHLRQGRHLRAEGEPPRGLPLALPDCRKLNHPNTDPCES